MRRASVALIAALAMSTLIPSSGSATSSSMVTAPSIAPIAKGMTVLATPARWSSTVKSTYKWLLSGKAISGATKTTYVFTTKQRSKSLQFIETATFPDGTSLQGKSNIITLGQVFVAGELTIDFKDDQHKALKVSSGAMVPTSAKVTYQWFNGIFDIPGAHSATYILTSSDAETEISVQASYTAKGFTTLKKNSNSILIPKTVYNYSLIWSDEFNASATNTVDPKIWVPQNSDGTAFDNQGWGNGERQWYTETQSQIDSSGVLTINAARSGANVFSCYYGTPCEWISSKFVTKGQVGFKYGRIESSIKGPVGQGTWAAFWLLGADIDKHWWPVCGEIDVTELMGGRPTTNYGTLHGIRSGGLGRGGTVEMPNGFSSEFHTYAIDWLPDHITWYLDGVAYKTVEKTDDDWVFDHEFYLIVNLAMGGNFPGAVDSSVTSATTAFDYIRVYSINGVGEVIKH